LFLNLQIGQLIKMNIPINILRKKCAHIDKQKKYIYVGHFKAGFTSARNFVLKDRSIRPSSENYNNIKLTEKEFNKIFKFTIIRNPFDRVLSAFYFLQKGNQGYKIKPDIDFNEWIKNVFKVKGVSFNNHFKHMHPKLLYEDKIWVDYIARIENIENDWKVISEKCDLPNTFPRKNISKKKDGKNRYDYYNDESIEIVSKIYKKDLELLNYEY